MSERLPDGDLEIIVGAIEGLSAKLDDLGQRPAAVNHRMLAGLIVEMHNTTRNNVGDRLEERSRRLDAATAALEQEGSKSEARLLQQRTALLRDTDAERDRRRRWQWIGGSAALLLIIALLAGPWLAHGYFVRTVSGCFALGGEFLPGKAGSGYPDVCWFDIGEPR